MVNNNISVLEYVQKDEKLLDYVSQLVNYKKILKDEFKYFFFASLISADALLTAKDCEKSIKVMMFIKKHIDYLCDKEEEKKETLRYVNRGLKIAKRDLNEFINNNKKTV